MTNKGGDLGKNHFDVMIPGGGFGIFNGCAAQSGDGGHVSCGLASHMESIFH